MSFPLGRVDERSLGVVRHEGKNAPLGAVEVRRNLAESLNYDPSSRREVKVFACPDECRSVDDILFADTRESDS
jgi:hypothetical protein